MVTNSSDRKIVQTRDRGEGEYRILPIEVIDFDETSGRTVVDVPEEEETSGEEEDEIGTVRNIQIESQTVKIQPDGSAVIDVVVSFDTASGADEHELRITKI